MQHRVLPLYFLLWGAVPVMAQESKTYLIKCLPSPTLYMAEEASVVF